MDNVPGEVTTESTALNLNHISLLEEEVTEDGERDTEDAGESPADTTITWAQLQMCQNDWRLRKDKKEEPSSVKKYYKKQDAVIESFEETDQYLNECGERNDIKTKQLYRAITRVIVLSFVVNCLLAIAKLAAAILSGSLSIVSSLVDSAVDLVSGLVIWFTTRAVKNSDIYSYPTGKTRLEPVAIVIISVVMALASVQMIVVSVEKLVSGVAKPSVGYGTIAIICSTVITKAVLFLYCRRVPGSTSKALAQDHRNDVLSNTLALACGAFGAYVSPYADPIGAIIISMYIAFSWWKTGREQIRMLTGHTASADFLQKITWICYNHHPKIDKIDTVKAFHVGINFLVEVHICLAENMTLKEAHDIGEPLQQKLERLPSVECAFVHLDYNTEHHPNIEHKRV